jgi:hypothetical protein
MVACCSGQRRRDGYRQLVLAVHTVIRVRFGIVATGLVLFARLVDVDCGTESCEVGFAVVQVVDSIGGAATF